eukprot:s145_g13.t1
MQEETFCPNVSDQFHEHVVLEEGKPHVAQQSFSLPSSSKDRSESASVLEVQGEEPCDLEPEKQLGEEPSVSQKSHTRFQGQKLDDIFILELFAGTARLTRCFGRKGFKALAFDKTSKRSEGQNVIEYHLSNKDEVDSLLSFIRMNANCIALIHLAPPCGTTSRARGKRLRFLRALNIKEPRPLRDDLHPDGFHWLSGSDKLRTEAANLLYEHTVLIARTAIELHIAITIDNPANSLMWKTTPFVSLFSMFPQLKFVVFHNCAHGGSRDKLTAFATNVDWFDSLALRCDGRHSHAPWTPTVVAGKVQYPTHSEAAYPEILCERMASLVFNVILSLGALTTDTLQQHVAAQGKSLNRVVMGALPRGKHVKPLVSEFGFYINVVLPPQSDDELQQFYSFLPKGSAVQSRLLTNWGCIRDAMDKQIKKHDLSCKLSALKRQNGLQQVCDKEEDQVKMFSSLGCVANTNFKLLLDLENNRPRDFACEKVVMALPREPLDFMVRAVEAGHPRNTAISLPPKLQKAVDWNRDAPLASRFSSLPKGRQTSQDGCQHTAVFEQRHECTCQSKSSSELSSATWEETEKELREGWMELDPGDGRGASWAMRFGLQQNYKVRVIDDFSIAGVNQTAGLHDGLKNFGTDDIAALLAYSLDSNGNAVHPTIGKTMDLRSAYKQFGICEEDTE